MDHRAILSLSTSRELLAARQATLEGCGYKVFSTISQIEARYEIEMGRCGTFLICYTVSADIHAYLAGLFMRSCPGGLIAFVMHPRMQKESLQADVSLLDSNLPGKLDAITSARSRKKKIA